MSEQIPQTNAPEFEPRKDNFEHFRAIEAAINQVKDTARQLAEVSYSSEEDAELAMQAFQVYVNSLLEKYPNIGEVPLRIGGEGVEEVVVQTQSSLDSNEGMSFNDIVMPDPSDPFSAVASYDSRNFLFDCWAPCIVQVAENDWRTYTLLYGEKIVDPIRQKTDNYEPFVTIIIKPALRINCFKSDGAIEVIDLADERERVQALHELSLVMGEDWPEVSGLIKKFDDGVNNEDLEGLADFDLEVLHSLGQLGAHYAASDAKKSYALTTAVAAILGTGRYLALDGVSYSIEGDSDMTEELVRDLCGSVETIASDVPLQASISNSRPAGPTFVIKNGKRTDSLPFTSVSRMSL